MNDATQFFNTTVGAGGYQIQRSVRFNAADTAFLNRTFGTPTQQNTFTYSAWVKRSKLGVIQRLFGQSTGPDYFQFDAADKLQYITANVVRATSTAVFRDTSAWYHIVFKKSGSTVSVYVNGDLVLSASAASSYLNGAYSHNLSWPSPTVGFNGYFADIHWIDGQALDPTDFGEFDTNNVWQPKAFSGGSYGTNGFHLDFSDNSTAAALGTDTSGNSNNWTVNNISVTAGAGNDSLVDSPTNYGTDTGAGAEVRGNYCTWNSLSKDGGTTLTNGNLDISSTDYGNNTATFFLTSGKWYWEGSGVGYVAAICGKAGQNWGTSIGTTGSNSIGWWYVGPVYWDGGNNSGATGYSSTDVIGTALDMDSGVVYFYKNGTLTYTVTFGSGTVPDLSDGVFPCYNNGTSSGTKTASYNFGQRPFAYTAPSGFKALCTQNLPTPTIADGSTAMDVALYTGNSSTQTISGLGFSPDLVWIKNRSAANSHCLFDTIRGATNQLNSNLTDAESTDVNRLATFTSDGFTVGNSSAVNASSNSYVAWTWDADSSTVTNNDGTISSQVRANASAGFSVVTYTGTGANATVGHGLNVAPEMIIFKRRNSTGSWSVYHKTYSPTQGMRLESTAAAYTDSTLYNNTAATSSVMSVGTTSAVNASGSTYVAYCFAPVAGYSAFDSYVGNGSTDGPMVYTGFRPKWLLIKKNGGDNWCLYDTGRFPENVNNTRLEPNTTNSEVSASTIALDMLSSGFKIRATGTTLNTNGATYIYAAFAEHPFQTSRAR